MPGKQEPLPPFRKLLRGMVDSHGGGSQKGLAKKLSCSQPMLSRLLSGKQPPSKSLLHRIEQLANIDATLLADFPSQVESPAARYTIPIASSLIRGLPADHTSQLTTNILPVSHTTFAESVYAVSVGKCSASLDLQRESLRQDDHLIVDSDPARWRSSVHTLHGKLCVIEQEAGVFLQRVEVAYDDSEATWRIRAAERSEKDLFVGARVLDISDPDERPSSEEAEQEESKDQTLGVDAVVGVVIQQIRAY